MLKKILYLILFLFVGFMISDVNALGSVSLSLSCPSAAKSNTTITCKVYGSRTGSEIESVENIKIIPSGTLKSASYLIDYSIIPLESQKNIGTVTINTGNAGTGYIELVFDTIHFVDETVQYSASVSKTISINSSGNVTNHNTVVSGESSNNNVSSNNNNNNNNNRQTNTSTDTHLSGIKLSRGILSPSFSKNVFKYTAKVSSKVDTISIDGIKGDSNQLIEGEVTNTALKYGSNTFKLVVSNGNAAKRTYEVVIVREDNRDTNASLASLSLSSGNIMFYSDVYEYETKVLYDITKLNILATPQKSTSTIKIVGDQDLKVGENLVTIIVKSEKGNTQKYTIKVTRLNQGEQIGDNSNIKDISIAGYNLEFDYSKQVYKLVIKKEKKLNISVVMDDPNASYEILGNENLKDGSVISIVTKSSDDTTTQTYNIEITKPNYTIYYVLGALLVSLVIIVPVVFYFKYVKPKKQLIDVNGNKIDNDDLNERQYRKKLNSSIPNNVSIDNKKAIISNDAMINQNVSNMTSTPPQYAVNIEEYSNSNNNSINGKCQNCGRELLGTPSICPYCNTKLR